MNQKKTNQLEEICRPLLTCICDYWQFVNAGYTPEKQDFENKINQLLQEAREDASKSTSLEREFSRIERPLVFFVDYIVKESNFPFANQWREMARKYNELSGDEKFFDLLSDALDDPDSTNALEIFYTMMGLGFDGIYQNNPEYIERRMKVCASRFSQQKFDVSTELLTPIDDEILLVEKKKKKNLIKRVEFVMLVAGIFMTLAFFINLSSFLTATKDFRQTMYIAAQSSVPQTIRNVRENEQKSTIKIWEDESE